MSASCPDDTPIDREPSPRYVYEVDGEPVVFMESSGPTNVIDHLDDFHWHSDDVLIASYPKSGMTWMSQIVQLVLNKDNVTAARQVPFWGKIHFLEVSHPSYTHGIDRLVRVPPPRQVVTHLPVAFFRNTFNKRENECPKVILVLRNPKDILVSYFHFHKISIDFQFPGTWNEFFDAYKNKQLPFGDVLTWAVGWWKYRNHPNVIVIQYEDLHHKFEDCVKRVAGLICPDEPLAHCIIDDIKTLSNFKSVKQDPRTNLKNANFLKQGGGDFFRKGEIGDWKHYFTDEQSAFVEKRCQDLCVPNELVYQFE